MRCCGARWRESGPRLFARRPAQAVCRRGTSWRRDSPWLFQGGPPQAVRRCRAPWWRSGRGGRRQLRRRCRAGSRKLSRRRNSWRLRERRRHRCGECRACSRRHRRSGRHACHPRRRRRQHRHVTGMNVRRLPGWRSPPARRCRWSGGPWYRRWCTAGDGRRCPSRRRRLGYCATHVDAAVAAELWTPSVRLRQQQDATPTTCPPGITAVGFRGVQRRNRGCSTAKLHVGDPARHSCLWGPNVGQTCSVRGRRRQ